MKLFTQCAVDPRATAYRVDATSPEYRNRSATVITRECDDARFDSVFITQIPSSDRVDRDSDAMTSALG
jgi:hypothetical protein